MAVSRVASLICIKPIAGYSLEIPAVLQGVPDMIRNMRPILLPALAALILSALAGRAFAAPLVDTAWLRQHLHDSNLVVLDIYDGKQQAIFESGHIPGALFTDYEGDGWRAQINGVPGMLPPIKEIEKVIGGFGIDNNSEVVLVPGGREHSDFTAITRVYWTFKVLGHDNVSILNGGDKAWFADASDPVATGATTPKPKTFVAHFQRSLLATRADVEKVVQTHDAVLIDARPPEQYEGKKKSPAVLKAGTLPGAVNVPAEQITSADGTRLADMATIDAVLAKAGVKSSGKQISFCNTGHLATGPWFLLHEIKGNKDISMYDGSMADWTRDSKLPVANGPRS
jgi:thiosulfate/3-mercaptopyruvate sulfurtransferase